MVTQPYPKHFCGFSIGTFLIIADWHPLSLDASFWCGPPCIHIDITKDIIKMTDELSIGKSIGQALASQRILYLIANLKHDSDTNDILNVIQKLRQLSKEGADLDYVNEDDNMTPLGHAIEKGLDPVINVLSHLGCNMDLPIKNKHPLVFAGMINPGFIDLLVNQGSGMNLDGSEKSILLDDIRTRVGEQQAEYLQDMLFPNEPDSINAHRLEHILFDFAAVREAEAKERNEKRRHYLKLLSASTQYRSYSLTPPPEVLDTLYERFPNFHEVLDHVKRQICLARLSDKSVFSMSPILLHGAPGIGKTRFIKELANVLSLEFNKIACGSVTAGWVIGGSSTSWEEGRPGQVLTSLRDGKTANPVIMLDEIDKMQQDSKFSPFGALYELLEDSTASSFVDEAIGLPIDCSKVSWISTANEVSSIPSAIVSRMLLIEVQTPTPEQMIATINSIMTDIITENEYSWGSRFSRELDPDIITMLVEYSPRDIRNMIKDAMGEAAVNRSEEIYSLKESDFISLRKRKRGPGFL